MFFKKRGMKFNQELDDDGKGRNKDASKETVFNRSEECGREHLSRDFEYASGDNVKNMLDSGGISKNMLDSGDISKNMNSGDNVKNMNSCDISKNMLDSGGDISKNMNSGDNVKNRLDGDISKNMNSGDISKNMNSGDISKNMNSGETLVVGIHGHEKSDSWRGYSERNVCRNRQCLESDVDKKSGGYDYKDNEILNDENSSEGHVTCADEFAHRNHVILKDELFGNGYDSEMSKFVPETINDNYTDESLIFNEEPRKRPPKGRPPKKQPRAKSVADKSKEPPKIPKKRGRKKKFNNRLEIQTYLESQHFRKAKLLSFLQTDMARLTNPSFKIPASMQDFMNSLMSFHILNNPTYEDLLFLLTGAHGSLDNETADTEKIVLNAIYGSDSVNTSLILDILGYKEIKYYYSRINNYISSNQFKARQRCIIRIPIKRNLRITIKICREE